MGKLGNIAYALFAIGTYGFITYIIIHFVMKWW